jgi:TolB-like protein/tRNA A-37 threonylcarbamoyl transferase component Bud32
MIGETISHYRVLERLGAGGMGEVYLAEDFRLHRRVALKMLRPEVHRDEEARARLLREARAASALNHPNIAVIYEIDERQREGGPVPFIAMEYVAGRTLGEMARLAAPTLDFVLDVARQIAEALTEAHGRGIVHRDVKPSNVMVTESGRVKVLDFGLAHQLILPTDVDSTWTRDFARDSPAGTLVGTVAYMSPEQARGDPIDGRADIFALGALLYELLAGRPPFGGRNAVQVIDALLNQEPAPLTPRSSDPRWPRLEAVVRRMLAKNREARYATMREVSDELAAVANGELPRAPLVSTGAPPAVAVMSFTNITGNGEDDWLGTGIAETVTADLKGVLGLAPLGRERVHETLRKLGAEGPPDDAQALEAGRELGARFVLNGGFQRAGEAVRVTARLTDVATGIVVRTVKIDGRLAEIFDLQDRIVRELRAGLPVAPVAGQPPERGPEETQVIEAYEAFSKGVLNLRVESHESLDRAVFFFEKAVRLDPAYARAHLELGVARSSQADYLAIPELHERALECFRRALELRPGLVRAWREMGASLVALCREDEGIEAIRRALELDPEDAGALAAMARAHFVGRAEFEEAARFFERALGRNPQGGWYALQLSHCLALLRDFPRGEAAARRAVTLQEDLLSGHEGIVIVGAHMRLGHLAALQERYLEAIEHFERERAFLERVQHALLNRILIELSMRTGAAHARLGHEERARAALALALDAFEQRVRLGADDPFTRYYAACVHAVRGDRALALDSLQKAAQKRRRFTLARARIEPEWDALRADPAFVALLEEGAR